MADQESTSQRGTCCPACGISRQQVLEHHNGRVEELSKLIRAAAPFVNAVVVIAADDAAGDPGPGLAWLADAARLVGGDAEVRSP